MFIGVEFVVSIIFVFCGECIVYDEGYGGARGNLVTNRLGDVFYNLDFREYLHLIPMHSGEGTLGTRLKCSPRKRVVPSVTEILIFVTAFHRLSPITRYRVL